MSERGVGALATPSVGIRRLGESRDPLRLSPLALVLAGLVGARLTADR